MPIEVRELVIRATIDQQSDRSGSVGGTQRAADNVPISNDCATRIEEIRKLIQDKNER